MTEKDYSLLRPFEPAAVKAGAKLVVESWQGLLDYVAGPDKSGWIVCNNENDAFVFVSKDRAKVPPLCWVEGKPVYPGDMLEVELVSGGDWREATVARSESAHDGERIIAEGVGKEIINAPVSMCRWPRPKPVKRWVNIYPGMYLGFANCSTTAHSTEEAAKRDISNGGSIACVEIELPTLKS